MSDEEVADQHRLIADRVTRALVERSTVQAVFLAGSVARGEHLATSDIDLLVVDADAGHAMSRSCEDDILVEVITHTRQEWIDRFDRPKASWLYAFLDAVVLHQVDDTGDQIKVAALDARDSYRASKQLRSELATRLWHGQAKLARVSPDDQIGMGYWAALCVETILDGLFTIHDVPLPAGSRRLAHLNEVPLTQRERVLLDTYLTGSAGDRFAATVRLCDHLRAELGGANGLP